MGPVVVGQEHATWSPERSPWANRAWASRHERFSSWENVTTWPEAVMTAGRSGSLAAKVAGRKWVGWVSSGLTALF